MAHVDRKQYLIIFAILGVAAKLERRRILERTARGRADAKEKGVKFGRKPTLTPHQQKEARKRLELLRQALEPLAADQEEDPPPHDLHRGLLSRVFTPRRVNGLEPKIRAFCGRTGFLIRTR